ACAGVGCARRCGWRDDGRLSVRTRRAADEGGRFVRRAPCDRKQVRRIAMHEQKPRVVRNAGFFVFSAADASRNGMCRVK
ncbi:hypothetical protein, partial [Burkholderia oklahomensis]|uniref:hypothetical protein n=1 Tax=Burkholderia oklahomensis TaxID=342113 RepID=UPI001E3665BF